MERVCGGSARDNRCRFGMRGLRVVPPHLTVVTFAAWLRGKGGCNILMSCGSAYGYNFAATNVCKHISRRNCSLPGIYLCYSAPTGRSARTRARGNNAVISKQLNTLRSTTCFHVPRRCPCVCAPPLSIQRRLIHRKPKAPTRHG